MNVTRPPLAPLLLYKSREFMAFLHGLLFGSPGLSSLKDWYAGISRVEICRAKIWTGRASRTLELSNKAKRPGNLSVGIQRFCI